MSSVIVRVDTSSLTRADGMIDSYIGRKAFEVESVGKSNCPVDKGNLRNSIQANRKVPMTWEVGASAVYARWIHEGQRFDPRSGRTIYVRRGPRPFLADALQAVMGGFG